jgi:hypothetical protein
LRPCTTREVLQQIVTDVDGGIVITIPTETSANIAVAAADAPHWNW